jgi:hypothetical protein
MRSFEVADPLRPKARPNSRWSQGTEKKSAAASAATEQQPATASDAAGDAVRARLLKMIVENEEARKHKSL